MEVTKEQYMEKVRVIAVPTKEVPHPKGGLGEGTLFWLHTVGMAHFGRPEFEIVDVPGFYIGDAAKQINHWAHFTIGTEINPGEIVREGETSFHPFIEVVVSPDPTGYWEDNQVGCLRLQLGAVAIECQGPGCRVH